MNIAVLDGLDGGLFGFLEKILEASPVGFDDFPLGDRMQNHKC